MSARLLPLLFLLSAWSAAASGDRFAYLEESDPFYPHRDFPKLAAPQWAGEEGVEAVVILAIDDMRDTQKYETFLRPVLDRLKKIDGRAPVSIYCNAPPADDPQLQAWLKEGVSLEVHTLSHPCPLLAKGNFDAAAETYHGCVDLLHRAPGNAPVAFRMPCCDSMNSPSPRFYAEVFNRTNRAGQFLSIDSSVMNIPTPRDPSLPRALVEENGRERFRKYLPFPSFVTTIEDYPYPYVLGKLCWEFPAMVPSDWEAQNLHGTNNPATVADWKAALDLTVLKQGTFTFIFHPHGWIRSDQLVEFIDYAAEKYGKKVKFLNFREALERLNTHLLAGHPLRAPDGGDNGARLLDLNHDGFLDVVIGNSQARLTRVWQPAEKRWKETSFPLPLVARDASGARREAGALFGSVAKNETLLLARSEAGGGGWVFRNGEWAEHPARLSGLQLGGRLALTREEGRDTGARLRDVNGDGRSEFIVSNPRQSAIFSWSPEEESWVPAPFALPAGVSLTDSQGRDHGLRFADLNADGFDDLVSSNPEGWSVHLFIATPVAHLGWERGWTHRVSAGRPGEPGEIPMIVRDGPQRNNGAWFHSGHLWIQNEDTAEMPDKVDRRSFTQLLTGVEQPPKSPAESLAAMRVREGFRVELAASEPQVTDPVAFEWGADGKLWVAEMRDYPSGMDGKGKPGGAIRFLEDSDDDGFYEKSTVFLENIPFPTGVMPWRKGILVSAAPEIFYAEDTDGDGKADLRRTILSGFNEGNQQHRVNGFEYGLDGWVYAANGDSGGSIRSALTGKTASLRGHDLRFHPDTGDFEIIPGQTQFGRRRDDWGHWFGNNNPAWLWQYHLPEGAGLNAEEGFSRAQVMLAQYEEPTRVFSISQPQARFNWPDAIRQVTSANSPTPYRDELFGPEYASSIFISEPANNVIHREVLRRNGPVFASGRAEDEQEREFLASADTWFRPAMLKTGPDGALYVADMYRLILEHPEYFPDELKQRPDLRAGEDRGRIYRIFPENARRRGMPWLDETEGLGLAEALRSPNGWTRDTTQRLLAHRAHPLPGETAVSSEERGAIVSALERSVILAPSPAARLQALAALDTTWGCSVNIIRRGIRDKDSRAARRAIHLAGRKLKEVSGEEREGLIFDLAGMARHDDAALRYQTAVELAPALPGFGEALASIALRDCADERLREAVLHSSAHHLLPLLTALAPVAPENPAAASLLARLALIAARRNDGPAQAALLRHLTAPPGAAWKWRALAGLADGAERRGGSGQAWLAESIAPAAAFITARNAALNPALPDGDRAAAASLLGRSRSEADSDSAALAQILASQPPAETQKAALARIQRLPEDTAARLLVDGWKSFSPGARLAALDVLLSRNERAEALLRAVESRRIAPAEIPPAARQRLLAASSESVRASAAKLLQPLSADRKETLKQFASVSRLQGGARAGAELFRQHCAVCHRLNGEGGAVGPDLATMAGKPAGLVLTAILDPSQAVETRYLSYTVLRRDGAESSGIVASETPETLTLRGAAGADEIIRRSDIQAITAAGLSIMPEGFENVLSPQQMADLISYVVNPKGE